MHLIYSVPIKDINYPREKTPIVHTQFVLRRNLRLTNQISTLKNFVFYQQCINLVFPTKKHPSKLMDRKSLKSVQEPNCSPEQQ